MGNYIIQLMIMFSDKFRKKDQFTLLVCVQYLKLLFHTWLECDVTSSCTKLVPNNQCPINTAVGPMT